MLVVFGLQFSHIVKTVERTLNSFSVIHKTQIDKIVMEIFITLFIVTITAGWLLYRRIFYYWRDLGVPQFPLTFPHGNAKGLGKDFHLSQFLVTYYQKTKEIGAKFSGIYTYSRPLLLIADLDLAKNILVKDFNIFPNRGTYYNEKDDPVSAHLFSIENDSWRNLRHKLSPTFTSGKLKTMFGTVSEVSDKLIRVVEKQAVATGQLEVKDTLARFTTDVIGSTAFGIECNSLEDKDSKFYEMGTKLFKNPDPMFHRLMKTSFKDLARKLHIKALPTDVSEFYMGITKETVNYREKNFHENRHDFMNLLVQMKKANEVTLEQIAAQSLIFFLAGYETSSSTMTNCMYEFAVNVDVQEKARQSLKAVLAKHGSFTYDAVADMDYLEQCVEETLRKYPVVSMLQRTSLKDYELPDTNVVIPQGQTVFIPVHAIHWDEDIYPEPAKFNPDRFAPKEKAKRHQYAYIPFGEGPRICIGMRLLINLFQLALR